MINRLAFSREQTDRCLLCDSPACSAACPMGMDPAKRIRSAYFDNEISAALSMPVGDPCTGCDAPCESACVRRVSPVHIRSIMTSLSDGRASIGDRKGEYLRDVDLSCAFCGVRLQNPFLLSSSVVASSYDKMARAFDMGWAGAATKTLCDFIPREASPRYAVQKQGDRFLGFKNIEQLSVNALGEDLEIIARLKYEYPDNAIIASIMGRDAAEWARLSRLVEQAGADIIECNFSCPNMEEDGLGSDVGQSPEQVARNVLACKQACALPVLAKLTPNVQDMAPMALAAVRAGADGICAINTIKSLMNADLDSFSTEPSVDGRSGVGGYSGRAVKPIALRFIREIASHPEMRHIPISGMGGIVTWRDAAEFMILGAHNVQVTTAVMEYGYRIIDDLIDGMKAYLSEKGMKSVTELVGRGIDRVVELDRLDRVTVEYPRFHPERCLGCGRCYISCRDGGHEALEMKNGHPVLDPKRCVGCHLCTYVCSQHAITASGTRRFSGIGNKK